MPGARYGVISAAFVVFTLAITDFGAPKVIGGDFNVLATDIYKQIIGQPNIEMGAVVSVVLLIPAALAFIVDRIVQKKHVALLTSGTVAYEPKPDKFFYRAMLTYALVFTFFILGMVAVLNMDDAGDIAPAAAMGMMIFYTAAGVKLLHYFSTLGIYKATQRWRAR